jgi:3-hydroxybutyryl-CoA dehydratase
MVVTGVSRRSEFQGYVLEDLAVGMHAAYARTVTEADIVMFAGVSGDMNPVHMNKEYAAHTVFKGPIAHGMLTASFISTVLGTKLPGPGCIYVSQDLRFKAPVRVGDTVRAEVTVSEILRDKKRVVLLTNCTVRDVTVLEGTAVVMGPSRADFAPDPLPQASSFAI